MPQAANPPSNGDTGFTSMTGEFFPNLPRTFGNLDNEILATEMVN
jgi:hypothetical protein